MKKILLTLLFTSTLISCKVGRFIVYNFADINDHKKFPARKVETGATKFIFPAAEKGKFPKELDLLIEAFAILIKLDTVCSRIEKECQNLTASLIEKYYRRLALIYLYYL